jgi:hypothetical protein
MIHNIYLLVIICLYTTTLSSNDSWSDTTPADSVVVVLDDDDVKLATTILLIVVELYQCAVTVGTVFEGKYEHCVFDFGGAGKYLYVSFYKIIHFDFIKLLLCDIKKKKDIRVERCTYARATTGTLRIPYRLL